MSHFSKVDVEIRDMEALERAVSNMGFEIKHNIGCRYWGGQEVMDTVIKLPGKYDCGVVKTGETYSLKYDKYGNWVEPHIGVDGQMLLINYSKAKVELEARKLRYKCVAKGEKLVVYNPKKTSEQLEVSFNPDGSASMQAKGFKGSGCMVFSDLEEALGVVKEHTKTGDYRAKNLEETRTALKNKI